MAASGGQYRINLLWTSHGGQVLSTMGQIQSGMRQVGGAAQKGGRDLGYFNRQLGAIGTTMRYMFAGGAIFGTMNAFNQFAEFQSRLGDIAALSPQLLNQDITTLGNQLLGISTKMATPVQELEESVRNIQSTLQLKKGEQMNRLPEFAELFSKGAKVAETDAYNFGNTIMGMRNAFHLGLDDMKTIAGEFFTVIQKSAGMTGDEWAKLSGRMVAGAKQAGATLEEMNAMMVLMSRQGATPATNIRHASQFLMQLRNPTKEAMPFWEDIGLPLDKLRSAPFETIMQTLMRAMQKRGGLTAEKQTEEQVSMLEELGVTPTTKQLGIGGGREAQNLLMDLFGRIEGRRAAGIILGGRMNPDETLDTYDELLTNLKEEETQAKNLDKAFDRWLDRNRIQQATIALRNMMTEALVPAEPAIRRISEFVTKKATPEIAQGAAAALVTYGLFRVGKGAVGVGSGAMRLMRGAGAGGIALTQMGSEPKGTFADPFWVIIHPTSRVTGGGGGGVPPVLGGPGGKGVPPATRAGRGARAVRAGSRFLLPVAAWATAMQFVGEPAADAATDWLSREQEKKNKEIVEKRRHRLLQRNMQEQNQTDAWDRFFKKEMPGRSAELQRLAAEKAAGPKLTAPGGRLSPLLPPDMASQLKISGQEILEAVTKVKISISAAGDLDKFFNITAVEENRGSRKHVHVPKGHNAWQGGATPQFRGADTVPRG